MKAIILAAIILATATAHASQATANHGHHGGLGNGAIGGQSSGAATGGESQSGQGGYLRRDESLVDAYQPWPESEMRKFQKP